MIYFVGAGCGAPDLITVRGMRLLEQADVIIYAGSLVNPALLQYAKEGCEIHNSAIMTLDEVLAVMQKAEAEKKTPCGFIPEIQVFSGRFGNKWTDWIRLESAMKSVRGSVRSAVQRQRSKRNIHCLMSLRR